MIKKYFLKIRKSLSEGGVGLLYQRVIWKLKSTFVGGSIGHLFIHSMDKGFPVTHMHVDEFEPTENDVRVAERIMIAFGKALKDEEQHVTTDTEDLWDLIRKNNYQDFFEVNATGNPYVVAKYLANMHRHSMSYGISDYHIDEYHNARVKFQQEILALTKDKIVALGEAVGAINVEDIRENIYTDSDNLVTDIARIVGIDITPPQIDGGIVKIKMGDGYFASRDVYSIYGAWRMNLLLGGTSSALCEIGAGMGKVALYAYRFGFKDYSIFDLPITNVAQSWYLIQSGLPVTLYGEREETDSVKILPYWEFSVKKKYEITLNMDSFAEIHEDIVKGYLNKIQKNSHYLLSINQERGEALMVGNVRDESKRHVVTQEVMGMVTGFKRVYRFPFWLRKGYVEELYQVNKTS